ncbi:MAG: sigma-70 family RNA polymerase sigma factor [Marinilabiliaceae bacterium]|nr:sigma-70 family RNA polymerase sigma factor [Marinilabiliaceae bacterium]
MHIETIGLINRSKKGDTIAFGQLVLNYSDYVFSVVFRLVNNEPFAEDLVQETFIKAWRNIKLYDASRSRFTTWLFTIATRLTFDWMKAHKEWMSLDVELPVGSRVIYKESDELENQELGQMIRKACRSLSVQQKMVFVMRDLEDLTVEEVVAITGFSEKKIKDNLYVARKKVREQLGIYLNSEL